jgi:signal transduction histidine kinase
MIDFAWIFKRTVATRREWGLFGLRWIFPAGLIFFAFVSPGAVERTDMAPVILIALVAVLTNMAIVLLLVLEYWAGYVTILALAIDFLLIGAAVSFTDIRLAWAMLIPAGLTGLYYDWVPGIITGGASAVILVVIQLLSSSGGPITASTLALLIAGFPSVGPLAALLSYHGAGSANAGETPQRPPRPRRAERAEKGDRRANEYIDVVYEMVEVLSASKLDPGRVLDAAVNFGLEGLERVGVKPPLYGMTLLFAGSADSMSMVLRVARASGGVRSADQAVTISGREGIVGKALSDGEPQVSSEPANDQELMQFEVFRACKTVMCLPLVTGQDFYGVMLVGSREMDAFDKMQVDLMRAVSNQVAASLSNAKLYASLREQRDRIVGVEKSARAKLAADLHDGPTQAVSAITMRLNYIRRVIEKNPPEAMKELFQIEDLARRTAKEIRAMLFELRPKSLEKGLDAGLQQLAVQMKETYDQNVEVQVQSQCDQLLDTQTALTLFSIATEATNNARKHAQASLIRIQMGTKDDSLILRISDDGKGFEVDKALAEAGDREGHLGLINLQERAALVEGTLAIDSAPGKGTRLTVTIPLEALRLRKAEEMERGREGATTDMVTTSPFRRHRA